MPTTYNSPGVYRQELFLKAPPVLQTGVPGFVGFAAAVSGSGAALYQAVALFGKDDFAGYFNPAPVSFLADVVSGFFDNGGVMCYVVAADPGGDGAAHLKQAIAALEPLTQMDLLAVPDAMTLRAFDGTPDRQAIAAVQAEALAQCERLGDRLAILDSLPGAGVADVISQRNGLAANQREPVSGALYYPWLVTSTNSLPVPPCGHVAGIYARSDARAGVFKAPANEELMGVVDLESQIDAGAQDQLNPARVNCLRALPGRGIRVWGARTVGAQLPDPNWMYVNVRRIFLTLNRWIDLNMAWAVFEPNDVRLWVRISRELSAYLAKLLRDGALRGTTEAEAFYVKCDAENNPPASRDAGQVTIEVGLAALVPAEFIVARIVRRAGDTSDN